MRISAVLGAVLIAVGLLILYVLRALFVQVIVVLVGVIGLVVGIILVLVGLALVFGRWRARRVRRYFSAGTPSEI